MNEQNKQKSKRKLETEKQKIEETNKKIDIRKRHQKMLERQTKIIGFKVWAMREYEKYL